MDDYTQSGNSPYGVNAGGAAGTAARMKEQITDTAADVKDRVTGLGRKAVEKIDESRESAAGALEQTASSLHASGEKVSGAAHSTANRIQATADYVRSTDLKGMAADVGDLVKRYPGQAMAVAAVLGFLLARGLSGRDQS